MKDPDWKVPSNYPLFASEIATISIHGRQADLELLDRILEEESIEDIRRLLIELADKIRSRHSMGMRKDCCADCPNFDGCELKWLKTERNMRPTCCPRCTHFKKCLEEFRKKHHPGRRRDDPPAF